MYKKPAQHLHFDSHKNLLKSCKNCNTRQTRTSFELFTQKIKGSKNLTKLVAFDKRKFTKRIRLGKNQLPKATQVDFLGSSLLPNFKDPL